MQPIPAEGVVAVVASVPDRVDVRHWAGCGEGVAPGVVGVLGNDIACGIVNAQHVALHVAHVEVIVAVVLEADGCAAGVILEVHHIAAGLLAHQQTAGVGEVCHYAIRVFGDTAARGIVGVADVQPIPGDGFQQADSVPGLDGFLLATGLQSGGGGSIPNRSNRPVKSLM